MLELMIIITIMILILLVLLKSITFLPQSKNILCIVFVLICIFSLYYNYIFYNPVYCETFDKAQHIIRVTIIEDLINQNTAKDNLLAINKCIKAKIALLNTASNFSNDLDLTPLISTPMTGGQVFKRLLFWFFCTFLCILLDGTITFGSYMLNDSVTLQAVVLSNFLRISSDYELVKDLYDLLVSLTIIHD